MADEPTRSYVTATILAGALVVLGVYLPWVRKRPIGNSDGEPIYTTEAVLGQTTGFQGLDGLVVLIVVVAVAAVLVARGRRWRPDLPLVAAGVAILVLFGDRGWRYWSVDRYAIDPGLYLLFVGGALFVLVGARGLLGRVVPLGADDGGDAKGG
jgi:hypothetical protein